MANDYSEQDLVDLHNDHVLPTYFPAQLRLVRGALAWVWDSAGNRYLDFTSGISVCNLGHCHPRVTAAIQRQAAKLVHVSNLFLNEHQPRLAALIAKHSFGGKVFFGNSGAEANEGMIKFARYWGHDKGRHEIICMEESFHGRTLATLAATGRAKYRKGFQPDVQGFVHVPFNDADAAKAAISEKTAAVLLEPIQGEGGVMPAEPAYLKAVRDICDEAGILLLFDEVQCGMGRSGPCFAYQLSGVEPDAMAMAKALANGFPIGAFEVQQRHAAVLPAGSHASTFGGSPLACAAGIAVFETIEQENVLENAQRMAAQLWQGLAQLKEQYGFISEIRGAGLMIGIVVDRPVKDFVTMAREKGLLMLSAGENVIRLLPPLTIDPSEVEQALKILADIFAAA